MVGGRRVKNEKYGHSEQKGAGKMILYEMIIRGEQTGCGQHRRQKCKRRQRSRKNGQTHGVEVRKIVIIG